MRDIATKVDDVGDTLSATDFNAQENELENVVTSTGQTLDPAGGPDTDLNMLGKALTAYGSAAEVYEDSGTANTYLLTHPGNLVELGAYQDGMRVTFKAGNSNTGASTINVNSLGAKNVTFPDGTALPSGSIVAGTYYTAIYVLSSDLFELLDVSASYVVDLTESDQGANTAVGNKTLKDWLDTIGTTRRATLYVIPNGVADTTACTFDTSLDMTNYPNIVLFIGDGVMFDRTTGDEVVTFYSRDNLIIHDRQQLTDVNMLAFAKKGTVSAHMWGALGDDSTDCTNAFTWALATGMDVKALDGTFLYQGGLGIDFDGQKFFGLGRADTVLKKTTTNYGIDTNHAVNFCELYGMTFDGDNLVGNQIIWRAHYSAPHNLHFQNQGGANHFLWCSGVNLSELHDISSSNDNAAGILIDQSGDAYIPQPTYGMLYSKVRNISLARTTQGPNLELKGNLAEIIDFDNCYIEHCQDVVPSIWVHGSNTSHLNFHNFKSEHELLQAPFIKVTGSSQSAFNVRFYGGRISTNVAQTQPVFEIDDVDGVSIEKIGFEDGYSSAGRNVIEVGACRNVNIQNNICSFLNNFNFIVDNGSNRYIASVGNTTRDYAPHTGVGTNLWAVSSQRVVVDRDAMLQGPNLKSAAHYETRGVDEFHSQRDAGNITVDDDSYYDIFGDGGSTSPGGNFSALVKIMAGTISSTSQNNFAMFYVQCSSSSTSQQVANVVVGSNVDIDTLADSTAAALSNTTDGMLGVQVGGGSAATRFVRVYNRLGAQINLKVDVVRFEE